MKQIVIKSGKAVSLKVPRPSINDNEILVETAYSCISIGTELSSVKDSGKSLLQKLKSNPSLIKKVLNLIKEKGISSLFLKLKNLNSYQPTGYSLSGTVVAIGKNISKVRVGDRVACAGAGLANHSQYVRIPKNLVTKIPSEVDDKDASTVTLGAIALQGIRRFAPNLGEVVGVFGLGFLGNLTCQFLSANGCHVIAYDPSETRSKQLSLKPNVKAFSDYDLFKQQIENVTTGKGLDGVIITASSKSNEVIKSAFENCRKKGRVVIVGDVGLKIDRKDIYLKEIDIYISTSYGPGRYDIEYEDKGIDYPYAYVRWTENRNMKEYLNLISKDLVSVKELYNLEFDLNSPENAYDIISNNPPLIAYFKYAEKQKTNKITIGEENKKVKHTKGLPRVSVAGAGAFAQAVHIPNLVSLKKYLTLSVIQTRDSVKSIQLKDTHDFQYAFTDFDLIDKNNTDLLLITSRHHEHFKQTLSALKKGLSVLVEKPTVMNREELNELKKFYSSNEPHPMLLTGFNRRFSPFIRLVKNQIHKLNSPVIINYVMNAGYLAMEHWVHGETGGGRNIGEACHIYDLFVFLLGEQIESISVNSIGSEKGKYLSSDNFDTTISFKEGHIANLIYTAMGSKTYPKERIEIYTDEGVIIIDDYKSIEGFGTFKSINSKIPQDKGHKAEIEAFLSAFKSGIWPISLSEQLLVNEIALSVEENI